jgi:hypothetical protein
MCWVGSKSNTSIRLAALFLRVREQERPSRALPACRRKRDNDFELFCAISKYNIKKSAFFTDETSKSIAALVLRLYGCDTAEFDAAEWTLMTLFFRPTRRLVAWKPFKDGCFFPPTSVTDKQVVPRK